MRYEDEPYVRLYKRETPEWTLLEWQARLIHPLVLKHMDRAGLLELGKSGWKALASLLRVPLAFVEVAMPVLLEDGCVALAPDGKGGQVIFAPNFIEAQEASQTDAGRKRAQRERARDRARAATLGLVDPYTGRPVTKRDTSGGGELPPSKGRALMLESGPNRVGHHDPIADAPVTKPATESVNETEPSRRVTLRHSELSEPSELSLTDPPYPPDGGEEDFESSGDPSRPIGAEPKHSPTPKANPELDPGAGSLLDVPPPPRTETHYDLAWKLWRELYPKSKRNYGVYVDAGIKDEHAMQDIAHRKEIVDLPLNEAEVILRHWFTSFLRDDGDVDFLVRGKHRLAHLERRLPVYGMPTDRNSGVRKVAPAMVSLGKLRPIDDPDLQKHLASIGKGPTQ